MFKNSVLLKSNGIITVYHSLLVSRALVRSQEFSSSGILAELLLNDHPCGHMDYS